MNIDRINFLRQKLEELEQMNLKLKQSRAQSVSNINGLQKKIEAEHVAVRYYDTKMQTNQNKYYEICDEIKALKK